MKRYLPLFFLGLIATTMPLFQGCKTVRSAQPSSEGTTASSGLDGEGGYIARPAHKLPLISNSSIATPDMPLQGHVVGPKQEAGSHTTGSATETRSEKGWTQTVWYGTNRKPTMVGDKLTYTSTRDSRTHHGSVNVWVPETHVRGQTGRPFWRRWWDREFRGDDYLAIQRLTMLPRVTFYAEVQEEVRKGGKSEALVYIHGFNVDFEEAAIRAAQLGFDLRVPGPTAFFSWPSLGTLSKHAYGADGTMIAESETALVNFLVEFAQKSGAKNVNIIAHSMGNRGLLRSLQRISADAQLRGSVKFNQIILASPDITKETFEQAAQVYAHFSTRTTLYTSNRDIALRFAPWFGETGSRAGYFQPYTVVDGVDTIVVPNFDVDLLGHSDYAQAEALLYDIEALCKHNEDPTSRSRINKTPLEERGRKFWSFLR